LQNNVNLSSNPANTIDLDEKVEEVSIKILEYTAVVGIQPKEESKVVSSIIRGHHNAAPYGT
jgi:hypothetical protein